MVCFSVNSRGFGILVWMWGVFHCFSLLDLVTSASKWTLQTDRQNQPSSFYFSYRHALVQFGSLAYTVWFWFLLCFFFFTFFIFILVKSEVNWSILTRSSLNWWCAWRISSIHEYMFLLQFRLDWAGFVSFLWYEFLCKEFKKGWHRKQMNYVSSEIRLFMCFRWWINLFFIAEKLGVTWKFIFPFGQKFAVSMLEGFQDAWLFSIYIMQMPWHASSKSWW